MKSKHCPLPYKNPLGISCINESYCPTTPNEKPTSEPNRKLRSNVPRPHGTANRFWDLWNIPRLKTVLRVHIIKTEHIQLSGNDEITGKIGPVHLFSIPFYVEPTRQSHARLTKKEKIINKYNEIERNPFSCGRPYWYPESTSTMVP